MAALEVGGAIPEVTVTPDRYITARYAGASGDFNPIHIDEEFAKSVGLPGRILHGLWTMAQVARAQTDAAGGPEHLRRLSGGRCTASITPAIAIVLPVPVAPSSVWKRSPCVTPSASASIALG